MLLLMSLFYGCSPTAKQVENSGRDQEKVNPVKERFAKMEADALKKPYQGIFSGIDTFENFFPIKATNVTTAPIVEAATQFLNVLKIRTIEPNNI